MLGRKVAIARHAAVALAVIVTTGSLVTGVARATSSDPAQWPVFPTVDADLDATPHTIRFSGSDRYQTNLALAFALRGGGDFPFSTSDRTSGHAAGLSEANGWWGAASCPRSIIVVAGDTFADALAAASLSDPTDRSQQPRLERVAAEDPLFDPIGGFDRPDTAYAPIVVTASGRSGANELAPTARVIATDLRSGGCTAATEAIIVGGLDAVPKGVERQLAELGYREVFRVAGSDRYETSANVATALRSSAPLADTCVDPASDGETRLGWYGNAAVEFRFDSKTCRVLPRAVVLADGGTGADALAAGWWTSYWQVPVLLTGPDGSLPTATRHALQTLDVDTVIVLGGVARIPESTVDEARVLAGATVGRIAGADRTATSIEMAKAIGGWHPTGDGRDFANDLACFAASGGTGDEATGWPDALALGSFCGRLTASDRGSPLRAVAPLGGAAARFASVGGAPRSHAAVPLILLPTGADSLSSRVGTYLAAAFDRRASWCSGSYADQGCAGPGFGFLAGGEHVIASDSASALTYFLSGGDVDSLGEEPLLRGSFPTALDLGPVFLRAGQTGGRSVCIPRGGVASARWLSFTDDVDRRAFRGEAEILRAGVYEGGGSSEPVCAAVPGEGEQVALTGVSIDGRPTPPTLFVLDPARHVTLSESVVQSGTGTTAPTVSHFEASGPLERSVAIRRGTTATEQIADAALAIDVALTSSGHLAVSGTFVVSTALGSSTGTVTGSAVEHELVLEIAGTARLRESDALGGFRATISRRGEGDATVRWSFDGY